jgi:hypothetical protein
VRRVSPSARYAALLILCCFVRPLNAQFTAGDSGKRFLDFTVGLGVAAHSAPSVVNYINAVAQPFPNQIVDQFNSAAEFYAIPELQVSKEWSMAIEYSLLIKSYSLDDRSGFSRTEMSYEVHMPTVLVHYLVLGEGFRVKLGGGIGYHFVRFDQRFPTIGSGETLRSQGLGFKLDAIGNTKFDDSFYGSIGIDLRWDFLGTLSRSGESAQVARSGAALPGMSFFNAGVKFGITFQLF